MPKMWYILVHQDEVDELGVKFHIPLLRVHQMIGMQDGDEFDVWVAETYPAPE